MVQESTLGSLSGKCIIVKEALLPYSHFSSLQKAVIVVVVSCCSMVCVFAQSGYYPSIQVMADDFKVSWSTMNATISTFQYTLAVFSLIWGNIADRYGRRYIYVISMVIYIGGSIGCALVEHISLFFVFRIIQPLGASSVLSLGAGTVSDIFDRESRGTAMGLYQMGTLLGLPLAPIVGGAVGEHFGWRAILWMEAIMGGVALFFIVFLLPETHRRLVSRKHKIQEINILPKLTLRENNPLQTLLYVRTPAVALVTFHTSMIFGCYSAVVSSNTYVMHDVYGLSESMTGLTFLGLEGGCVLGSMLGGRFIDWVLARENRLRQSYLGSLSSEETIERRISVPPEVRIQYAWPSALLFVASTIGYGWMARAGNVPLAAVIVMQIICGFMGDWQLISYTNYIVDLFPSRSASAYASQMFYRAIWSGVCIQLLIVIESSVGWGWEFTIFGLLSLFSFLLSLLVVFYGEALRRHVVISE